MEREEEEMRVRERERQSHLVCLISGRIIWLAGGKLLYQSPKGQSDFLNHFNKLEECDCPDSAAVSVVGEESGLVGHTSITVFFDLVSDGINSGMSHQPGRLPCMEAEVSALSNLKVSLLSTPTLLSSEIPVRGSHGLEAKTEQCAPGSGTDKRQYCQHPSSIPAGSPSIIRTLHTRRAVE
ncbi:hypothetical protein NQZ68_035223 [Dissostichus eleginoides]|nr:hypothetical protein NQZ68_035223 [Dissostichus eleginoides]